MNKENASGMHDELISKQAAIDALDEQIRQCDKALSAFDISMKDAYAVKVERASLVAFRETLEYVPSAQQTFDARDTQYNLPIGTDLISRKQAIDLWDKYHYTIAVDAMRYDAELRQLPSAQPEIIRCCECKYLQCNMRPDGYLPKGVDEFECRHWCGSCDPMDFCSRAERREVTT